MVRRLGLALVAGALAAAPAPASEDDFGARVRQYLLDNPEVILEAMEVLAARQAEAEVQARIAAAGAPLFDPAHAVVIGDPAAPLRIVELFDYRCASCKAGHPAVEGFVAANPRVAVLLQQLPILGPQSERAARAFHAVRDLAGPEAALALHEALFAFEPPITAAALEAMLRRLGHDPAAVAAAMQADGVSARIDAMKQAAAALGVTGTPVFLTARGLHQGVPTPQVLAGLAAALAD